MVDLTRMKDMVLVPTHALYVGNMPEDIAIEDSWLKGFPGEGSCYELHADVGVKLAYANEGALLLFSGGQTVKDFPISEAFGYWKLEEQKNWLDKLGVRTRAELEEFARDSFETLDFGIKRFRQITGNNPSLIDVVGWGFKKERYMMHAETLGLNHGTMIYHSVNEPSGYPDVIDKNSEHFTRYGLALLGEKDTVNLFKQNPLGDKGRLLDKRLKRNPHFRGNPYK